MNNINLSNTQKPRKWFHFKFFLISTAFFVAFVSIFLFIKNDNISNEIEKELEKVESLQIIQQNKEKVLVKCDRIKIWTVSI